MINANELRIDNLVEYKITDNFDERKEWWEISKIDADDIHWLSKVDSNDDDFRPIPLTEEILLKCGFVKYGTLHNSYKKNPFIIEEGFINNDHYVFRKITSENESYELKKIKHLHQLQNLYFELTNKELTINL